ncbi:MAG TPA: TSUP family transporter [Kofleriaceae bacterium]|nr:TSUP family transporter [Kofleriaceae bacterium]
MDVLTIVLLSLASLGAGTVDAIAGGGGLITVPALLAAGLPPHQALGTNKGQSVWGAGMSLATFWRAGRVDRAQAMFAFPLGFFGSLAGVSAVIAIDKDALKPVVIAMLIGAAVLLVIKKPSRDEDAARPRAWIAALLALVIGAYDGFFGPGTGTFLIVGFVTLCGRSLVHASADAKVVNFASNLAAAAIFANNGFIVWQVALPMAGAQLCGGFIGAHLAMRGGERVVRGVVLCVSGALIIKLVLDLIPASAPAPTPAHPPPTTAIAPSPAVDDAAPADLAITTAAAYETRATALTDQVLAMFAADGTNCDRLATDLTSFVKQNRGLFARLKAFAEAHPEAEQAFEDKMQAREQEIDAKLAPTLEACKDHEGLAAAIDKLPKN